MSSPYEWVSGPVRQEIWDEARAIREQRFGEFGWIGAFDGAVALNDREHPELGEVGEICLRRWLTKNGMEFLWHTEDPRSEPDFTIGTQTIDVKTRHRKRNNHMTERDEFGLRRIYVRHGFDWFFFCGYEKTENVMTFYGAISLPEVCQSRVVQPGDILYGDRRLVTPDPSYETPIGRLIGPYRWLDLMRNVA
jgi:hypothetical protein